MYGKHVTITLRPESPGESAIQVTVFVFCTPETSEHELNMRAARQVERLAKAYIETFGYSS